MHQSVMVKEVVSYLNLKPGYIVLDATVGGGGHARSILQRITPGGMLIGIDADQSALTIAADTLKDFQGSFKLINANFRNLDHILAKEGISNFNAVLFDIGISSYQIDDELRGFSMRHNARLDMRMDSKLKISAYEIVNRYKEEDLSDIIMKYGEDRHHNRIARYIVKERSKKPIETTQDLAAIVRRASGFRHGKIDSATRTFQAIRIAVNDELGALEEGLKKAVSYLAIEASICVISFHSLEDRIVKHLFKGYASLGVLKIMTKKPLRPSREEALANPRSRSAKMRVASRV